MSRIQGIFNSLSDNDLGHHAADSLYQYSLDHVVEDVTAYGARIRRMVRPLNRPLTEFLRSLQMGRSFIVDDEHVLILALCRVAALMDLCLEDHPARQPRLSVAG